MWQQRFQVDLPRIEDEVPHPDRLETPAVLSLSAMPRVGTPWESAAMQACIRGPQIQSD